MGKDNLASKFGNRIEVEPGSWDVSDIDRVTMFPKDCRFYNGGLVASKEIQSLWDTYEDRTRENRLIRRPRVVVIDRLRAQRR